MKKILGWSLVIIGLLGLAFVVYKHSIKEKNEAEINTDETLTDLSGQAELAEDIKNTTYIIDGTPVALVDGVSEVEAAPGSASIIRTEYFGNELVKDIDDDGRDDVTFLLTQETGGSGTFFYVVAALNTEAGYVGTTATLLGDRIAPQSTESGSGRQVIVNYADRAVDEPMTARPTIGKSLHLLLNRNTLQFGEVAVDFEGEADPARMTLTMQPWTWQGITYDHDPALNPVGSHAFVLTFGSDGNFTVASDCNNIGGTYTTEGDTIAFSNVRTTLMYCEGSQESEFMKALSEASSYRFTSRGELVFDLKSDNGLMIFL